MFASRPAVHPVEAPPLADAAENPLGVRMKDVQGMPGTPGGLALRLVQFAFAVAALGVMTSTSDFPSVTASDSVMALLVIPTLPFSKVMNAFFHPQSNEQPSLVAAAILQSLWSISLAFLDVYALLVRRCLRNSRALCWFTIGDGITATLTFASACASAGITVLISNDLNLCSENHCTSFETAAAMAFIGWCAVSPSFLLNLWSLACR